MSPTGDFLSIAKESHQRTPAETHGFCTSFLCTRAASEVPPKRGLDCLLLTLPLHCEGERDCCSTVGNPYVPAVDASFSSPEPGAAAGLLLRRFPLWPITNETLESKGSPETIGLWRLFCPLFQLVGKVGRRRHVSYANVLLKESHPPEAIEEKTTGKICRRRHVPYANVLLAERHPSETIEEGIPSGRKRKIPQKRIDISLIPAII